MLCLNQCEEKAHGNQTFLFFVPQCFPSFFVNYFDFSSANAPYLEESTFLPNNKISDHSN